MLTVAVNNLSKKEEIDFREKVGQTMRKQILKKIIGQENGSRFNPIASHSCTKSNNIEQIQKQKV